ncbi:magnesium transporter [bacterium]|nr:magnesium transporter [bacterium]
MALSPLQVKMTKRLLKSGNEGKIAHALEKFHPSDISILFSELDPAEMQKLLDSLFLLKKAGKTIIELPEFLIPDVLEMIEDKKLTDIIARLEPDDAHYLMEKIPAGRWKNILDSLPENNKRFLDKLLLYPHRSAGAIMNTNFVAVKADWTVEEAINHLRNHPETHGVFYIYVVDDSNMLLGVQSLRHLVVSKPGSLIRDVMDQGVNSVLATASQEEAAQIVTQYNLLALPVVNENRELVGVITVDDVLDIVEEEAAEDIYHLAGLSETDRAATPVWEKVKKRFPWMLVNLCTAGLISSVVHIFESTIQQVVILAVIMNIVTGLGGNTAIQSLTVVTRAIAMGELGFVKLYKVILKEMANGLILGMLGGVLIGTMVYFLEGNLVLSFILLVALTLNLVLGGLVGAGIPLVFRSMKLDPAVGTSVIVTMTTDVMGNIFFLGFATLLMKFLL